MARSDWVPTRDVCTALGVQTKQLWKLREQRVLKPNYHYRNISPQGGRPTYRWHLKRCIQALEV